MIRGIKINNVASLVRGALRLKKYRGSNKGFALLAVLVVLMVVVILANAVMFIMLNQSRITRHRIDRTRAYYAAMAGINLAYERLRRNEWVYDTTYCIQCNPADVPAGQRVADANITYPVMIVIGSRPYTGTGPSQTTPIQATVNYTFQ